MQTPSLFHSLPYHGGNGPLFSLLASMLESEQLSKPAFRDLIRDWGKELASQLPMTGVLEEDLNLISALLRTMGLVRVFEPHTDEEIPGLPSVGERQVLVMRCLMSRYINRPRVKVGLPKERVLPLLVDGLLDGAGHALYARETSDTTLRPDEYMLSLHERDAGRPWEEEDLVGDADEAPEEVVVRAQMDEGLSLVEEAEVRTTMTFGQVDAREAEEKSEDEG